MMEGDALVTNENPDAAGVETLPAIEADLYCPRCAYNLRGSVAPRCSECGYDLSNLRSAVCHIPWVRRRELGRFRAYWATVGMLLFRNRRFCEEYARPQRYTDMRTFQWVTIMLVFATVVAAVSVVYLTSPAPAAAPVPFIQALMTGTTQPRPTLLGRVYAEVWPVAIPTACVLPFLMAVAVMPTYFFHPRTVSAEQQDSGIILSGYAFGAMVLVPLLPVFGLAVLCLSGQLWDKDFWLVYVVLSPLAGLCAGLLVWWKALGRLARHTMPHLKLRRFAIAAAVPALWAALAVVFLVGFPLVVFYVLIVWASLG